MGSSLFKLMVVASQSAAAAATTSFQPAQWRALCVTLVQDRGIAEFWLGDSFSDPNSPNTSQGCSTQKGRLCLLFLQGSHILYFI